MSVSPSPSPSASVSDSLPLLLIRPLSPSDSSARLRFIFRRGMNVLYYPAIQRSVLKHSALFSFPFLLLSLVFPSFITVFPFALLLSIAFTFYLSRQKLLEYFEYSQQSDLLNPYSHYFEQREKSHFWVAELTAAGVREFSTLIQPETQHDETTAIAPRKGIIVGMIALEYHGLLDPAAHPNQPKSFHLKSSSSSSSSSLLHFAELKRMSVISEYRRCGIASLLLHTLLDYAHSQRLDRVFFCTSTFQHAALKLYGKAGFRVLKSEKEIGLYRGETYDYHWIMGITLVWCEKRLNHNSQKTANSEETENNNTSEKWQNSSSLKEE